MLTSILVHIEPDHISHSRLECAAQVARRFNAKLIGVAAAQLRAPVVDNYGGVALAVEMEAEEERIRTGFKNSEASFRNSPAVNGLQTEWRSVFGLPEEVLVRESRAADVIVLGRAPAQLGVFSLTDLGDVLMHAGRPVLVVPDGTRNLDAKRIVIGWKDTREARRACLDALPLLQKADLVSVVEVVDESEIEAAKARVTDVAAFLGRHDVRANAEPRVRAERSVAHALMLAAEQRDADLIVAGAYGHTRLREWVFGGVTSDLLTRSPRCSFLAH
ncbi:MULTISPECIES: universal stress protein [unclassified Bradyrhizobium]|uniref:universal stress protein n=1 Tax=unclassified Bradyrhizobium TaxID=2631580 RepID=UPI001FFBF225|nr:MULTISPECIES: universal stress protein [unclassified Bradyrhizobium]MCK1713078.1 universal stress protein [Bradyrhizobium sp. 143]MCK1730500.1 universal stress protein [Bradyrhizobium sp. 142]